MILTAWWTEKDFEFGKHTGTRYTWPRDRMICFRASRVDKDGRVERIIIPSFSLETVGGKLEEQTKAAVKFYFDMQKNGADESPVHIHVIEVDGFDGDEVGIMVFDEKCEVETDFWSDANSRKRRILERQDQNK